MEVSCPACHARYVADEDKLRGKTARMRCKACETVWLVSGPGPDPEDGENRAAVIKRGTEREQRDLFATRPPDLGSVRQTLRTARGQTDEPGGVAARNETSVLFTVDSLPGSARVKTPQPERSPMIDQPTKMDDDEGIIDLNALASTPMKAGNRAVASLFPSEPPPGAFARDANDSADFSPQAQGKKKKARIAIFAGGGVVAAALLIVGLSVAFRGEEPVARTAAFSPPPPPVAATFAPPPAADPPPAAPVAGSDESKAPTVGVDGKKGKGKKHTASASGASSFKMSHVQSSGTDAVSKPAPKASDPCGCHGDFNCALACAVKK